MGLLFTLLPIQQLGELKSAVDHLNTFGRSLTFLSRNSQEWFVDAIHRFYWGATQKTWDSYSEGQDQIPKVSDNVDTTDYTQPAHLSGGNSR